MTFSEFRKKYLGKKVDWDGAYAGQCVDLFRQYVNDVLNLQQPKGVVGAKDFWTNYETDPSLKNNFQKIVNTPTGVPQEGDVMIWGAYTGNPYGHISIFIKGDVNKFVSLDQNFPTLSKVTETEHNYTKPRVLGWLRPMVTQETVNNVALTELQIKYADLQKLYKKELDKVKTLEEQNNSLKSTSSERQKVIDELKMTISKLNVTASQLNTENDALKNELEALQSKGSFSPYLKALIEARRAFLVAFVGQFTLLAPQWEMILDYLRADYKSAFYVFILPSVFAGLKGVLKLLQEKYGKGDYSKLVYKI